MSGKWLARFAADPREGGAVPLVPIVPLGRGTRAIGTNGTIGTRPLQRRSGLETFRWGDQDLSETGPELDPTEVNEREAMAVEGGVPATFARTFAVFQLARPAGVSRDCWELAINDAGRFLDTWGHEAERLGWSAPDVIGPSRHALVWALNGARVTRLTTTTATLSDGRTFTRAERAVA